MLNRFSLAVATLLIAVAVAMAQAPEPRGRVVVIVDNSAYPELKEGLDKYAAHVLASHRIVVEPRPDDYYEMQPPAIRDRLRSEYQQRRLPRLVGAIMVGPIPHACRSHDPKQIMVPLPLYYEDFDAVYEDRNGDGVYSDDEITNDRVHNPTEIWTAWWVPPALEREAQVRLLKGFLDKLDRYYRDEITGRDQMLWTAGNVVKVEDVEGWSVLLKDTMKPLDQQLRTWAKIGQDTGTFRPFKMKDEHGPTDFVKAFTLQPWQHAHIIAHGNQRGWYWDNTGVCVARAAGDKPEWSLLMDVSTFGGTAANIVTTSGCSNGNFRGDYVGEHYDRALANILLFSPETITIAYYGAASPQSTSGFASYCTELIESLRADGDSYLAEGYFKKRNHDYSWGTQHFFFRGGDEKILSGDPFARYRDSKPWPADKLKEIEDKIAAAKWIITPEW
ncbi:MAG: hypothetical protein IPM18_10875 [Phycisphaerales bacterium]|nr:hypothetical protein [Phycisphaerales bacterium]